MLQYTKSIKILCRISWQVDVEQQKTLSSKETHISFIWKSKNALKIPFSSISELTNKIFSFHYLFFLLWNAQTDMPFRYIYFLYYYFNSCLFYKCHFDALESVTWNYCENALCEWVTDKVLKTQLPLSRLLESTSWNVFEKRKG